MADGDAAVQAIVTDILRAAAESWPAGLSDAEHALRALAPLTRKQLREAFEEPREWPPPLDEADVVDARSQRTGLLAPELLPEASRAEDRGPQGLPRPRAAPASSGGERPARLPRAILAILAGAGADGMDARRLAHAAGCRGRRLTVQLLRLRRAGYIVSFKPAGSRRVLHRLTPAGHSVAARLRTDR